MSDAFDQIAPTLVERRCARCDYDLTGLPARPTVCPECGQTFDERLIVLRGRHGGRRRGELHDWLGYAQLSGLFAMMMVIANLRSPAPVVIAATVAAGVGYVFIERELRKALAPHPSYEAKLFVRAEGFWQPAGGTLTTPSRWQWAVMLAATGGAVFVLCVLSGWRHVGIFIGVLGGVVGGALAQHTRNRLARAANGDVTLGHAVIPWSAVTRMSISPTTWFRTTDVLSIELYRATRWSRRTSLVDFDWPTMPEKATALATLMRELTRDADHDVHGLDRIRSLDSVRDLLMRHAMPKPPAPAPDFSLPDENGRVVRLSEFVGKSPVVIYFYPKADTPGCTKEACGFRDAIAFYAKLKVPVFGISPDVVADVKKFSDKFALNFPLLADADHAVSERYGCWVEKPIYGMGTSRTTFIVGKDGKIAHVFEKVKPEGHDQEVLEWLRANAGAA